MVPSTPAISRRQFLSLDCSAPSPGAAGADADYWIRVYRRVMACRFEVVLPGGDARFLPAARTALNLADRLEARLTVFRDTSELSRVNRLAADGPVPLHPGLFDLLSRAADLHVATGGAFDITSTPLSRCWGFLQRAAHGPTNESIEAARATVGMRLVELDDEARTVRFARAGVELNLGSIGKGYALDRMGAKLRRMGVRDALISAGGSSILALGADRDGWLIDVTSKLCNGIRLAKLRLRDVAMATSGAGEQFVVAGDRRFGHVLDPRSGWPAAGVLIPLRHRVAVAHRGHLIRPAAHQFANEPLQIELVGHEVLRHRIEERGVRGFVRWTEIVDRVHESAAEVLGPHAVGE